MVALLSATLLPVLAEPRSDGRAFRCLNNTKQLTLAWLMYAGDNGDRFCAPGSWVTASTGYNYEDWSTKPGNTNLVLMLSNALIAPYLKTPATFKCPADVYDGPIGSRVRSYSLEAGLGGSASFGRLYPGSAPRIYFPAGKTTDLNLPGPSRTFAFLDEHPDSINDGTFVLDAGRYDQNSEKWQDYPGSFHDGAVSLSFADGHSEIHKWTESRTCQQVEYKSFSSSTMPINSNVLLRYSPDYEWLEDRMPYHF